MRENTCLKELVSLGQRLREVVTNIAEKMDEMKVLEMKRQGGTGSRGRGEDVQESGMASRGTGGDAQEASDTRLVGKRQLEQDPAKKSE